MKSIKKILVSIGIFSSFHCNCQDNRKLSRLNDYEIIQAGNFNFFKVSSKNIDTFLNDSNTIILKYSTWCHALDSIVYHIESLKKIQPNIHIYLITSDLSTTIDENIEYLKSKSLYYDILYLDPLLYKSGNWGVKYSNFIKSICPDCKTQGINTTKFGLFKKNGSYSFGLFK
jgi:hypothetical protein